MKGRSRKQKGKRFEDKIAALIYEKYLSKIPEYQNFISSIEKDKIKKLFLPTRDYASGSSNRLKGDIDLSIGFKYFPFLIECKKWKSLDYKLHFILNLNSEKDFLEKIQLGKIYSEIKSKAEEFDLYPMVVFEYNRGAPLMLVEKHHLENFISENRLIKKIYLSNPFIILFDKFIIMSFEKFLDFLNVKI